jgi:hypothetical protein
MCVLRDVFFSDFIIVLQVLLIDCNTYVRILGRAIFAVGL